MLIIRFGVPLSINQTFNLGGAQKKYANIQINEGHPPNRTYTTFEITGEHSQIETLTYNNGECPQIWRGSSN